MAFCYRCRDVVELSQRRRLGHEFGHKVTEDNRQYRGGWNTSFLCLGHPDFEALVIGGSCERSYCVLQVISLNGAHFIDVKGCHVQRNAEDRKIEK